MSDKSNDLFENLEILKEYKWLLMLVCLIITISKDFIKNIIGSFTYNTIITYIMSILGIYVFYQLIKYIKNNDKYDIKNMKKELIIYFIMILITVIYLISLFIV